MRQEHISLVGELGIGFIHSTTHKKRRDMQRKEDHTAPSLISNHPALASQPPTPSCLSPYVALVPSSPVPPEAEPPLGRARAAALGPSR